MILLERYANPAVSKDGTRIKVVFFMWCGVREYLHTVLPLLEWCAIPVACGVKGRNQDQGGFLCAVGS